MLIQHVFPGDPVGGRPGASGRDLVALRAELSRAIHQMDKGGVLAGRRLLGVPGEADRQCRPGADRIGRQVGSDQPDRAGKEVRSIPCERE